MKADLNALMTQVVRYAHSTFENLMREQPDNAAGLRKLLASGKSRLDARVRDVLGAEPMIEMIVADAKGEQVIGKTPMKVATTR